LSLDGTFELEIRKESLERKGQIGRGWDRVAIKYDFYSAAALLAMQNVILATAIPSVSMSVRMSHAGALSRRMKVGIMRSSR